VPLPVSAVLKAQAPLEKITGNRKIVNGNISVDGFKMAPDGFSGFDLVVRTFFPTILPFSGSVG
jgi:hypothetical protein